MRVCVCVIYLQCEYVYHLFLKWSLKLIICSLLIGFSMILSAPDNFTWELHVIPRKENQ